MDKINFPNISQTMGNMSSMIAQDARNRRQMEEDNHKNTLALLQSSESLQSLLDGRSTFAAIKSSVEDLAKDAPEDHDTLIAAFGLIVDEVRFQHPHTIILKGTDQSGNRSSIVAHFSQVAIEVIHVARSISEPSREVGFHTI